MVGTSENTAGVVSVVGDSIGEFSLEIAHEGSPIFLREPSHHVEVIAQKAEGDELYVFSGGFPGETTSDNATTLVVRPEDVTPSGHPVAQEKVALRFFESSMMRQCARLELESRT